MASFPLPNPYSQSTYPVSNATPSDPLQVFRYNPAMFLGALYNAAKQQQQQKPQQSSAAKPPQPQPPPRSTPSSTPAPTAPAAPGQPAPAPAGQPQAPGGPQQTEVNSAIQFGAGAVPPEPVPSPIGTTLDPNTDVTSTINYGGEIPSGTDQGSAGSNIVEAGFWDPSNGQWVSNPAYDTSGGDYSSGVSDPNVGWDSWSDWQWGGLSGGGGGGDFTGSDPGEFAL